MSYVIENGLTTESTLKQELAIIKKTSVKQAEVARSSENYEERYASSIIKYEQVPITNKYHFVPKKHLKND